MSDGKIYVCDACLRRGCWEGLLYCDEYQSAGLVLKTKAELDALKVEDPSYYNKYFDDKGNLL